MSKKLIYLVPFVLGLVLMSTGNAADPDLVGWWKLDENSGTTAIDSSGYGNDGRIYGATWTTGKIGSALQFDGRDDYVDCGNDPSLNINDKITVAAWVKTTSTAHGYFVSKGTAWDEIGHYAIGQEYNVPMTFQFEIAGSGGTVELDSDVAINDGEWHHIVGTYDDPIVRVYVDGVEKKNATTSNLLTGSTVGGLTIGQRGGNIISGTIDEVHIYSRALTEEEIKQVMKGTPLGVATDSSPADKATDVPREVVLSWTPGEFAGQHDIYFGTSFDDVDAATNLDPMGPDNLYRARQAGDNYSVPERLDFGQTYYWRIDEVNAPPTSHVVFKGDVWSFTTESFAYPIENIAATASTSSFNESTGPENTVDGSGLDADDLHSVQAADIWLTSMTAQPPIWIQYQFDKVYKLYKMWVWNFNQTIEPLIGFGFKDVTVEYSADGTDWAQLAGVPEFARAPGTPGYAHNTTVDFNGAAAKYVRITANDNWGFLTQYGLSEVRFLYIPVLATEPSPASGAANVPLDVNLGFRAGREAAKHDVYLSADEQAVIDGTADVTTVTETSYGPLSLDLARTYYWRVDEVNEAETPTTWQGDIWDFVTQEYLVVENFEGYDDFEPNRIFDTWVDGWGVPTNGATMGYPNPIFVLDEHFVETTIVHSGSQSTPLFYDNTAGATYSEATRTVDAPRDWTQAGVKALTLWFHGDPNNSATEQMYVKVNGSKVTYDGDSENLTQAPWQVWYIDLADFGVNLSNVTELTIGLERGGAVGGKGVVYFDDIRLSPYDRQLVTPAEPNDAGLLVHWPLDEGSGTTARDVTGNGYDGAFQGDPQWVAGKLGGALQFDGVDDYVIHTLSDARNYDNFTVALWARAATLGQGQYMSPFSSHTPNSSGIQIDVDGSNPGFYRTNPGTGNRFGPVTLDWIHLALVGEGTTVQYYYNGSWAASGTLTANNLLFNEFIIGVSRNNANFFAGTIDDFRVYDRALTQDEIAWLGGRTTPFDKPFRSP